MKLQFVALGRLLMSKVRDPVNKFEFDEGRFLILEVEINLISLYDGIC